jgi:hypothetical protein
MNFAKFYLPLVMAAVLSAQHAPQAVLGAVIGFNVDAHEIRIQPDNGKPVSVKFGPETEVVRIPPGEHDLKKAQPAKLTDIVVGDRVMASFVEGMAEARRLVLISATDITRRNEAERLDWQTRGVWGVVTAKNGNTITLRTFQGGQTATVTVRDKTKFRRYAPDSVKFSDAQTSRLAGIAKGDQVRARGEKSPSGLELAADEVVSGTFVSKAGTVATVNAAAGRLTIDDLVTKRPLTIRVAADSLVKSMSEMGGHGRPESNPFAGPAGMGRMLDQLPAARIESLKAGDQVVVVSTAGAKNDRVTAILLLTNAGFLFPMMQMALGGAHSVDSMHAGIMGPQGLNFPGMIQ